MIVVKLRTGNNFNLFFDRQNVNKHRQRWEEETMEGNEFQRKMQAHKEQHNDRAYVGMLYYA